MKPKYCSRSHVYIYINGTKVIVALAMIAFALHMYTYNTHASRRTKALHGTWIVEVEGGGEPPAFSFRRIIHGSYTGRAYVYIHIPYISAPETRGPSSLIHRHSCIGTCIYVADKCTWAALLLSLPPFGRLWEDGEFLEYAAAGPRLCGQLDCRPRGRGRRETARVCI